jgi:hypothetical protein
MSRDRTLSDIRPYLPMFLEIVNGGWGDYYGPDYVRVAPKHSRSSTALLASLRAEIDEPIGCDPPEDCLVS